MSTIKSRNNSPRATNTPQKKVAVQSSESQLSPPKQQQQLQQKQSPQKQQGVKSPPHSPSQQQRKQMNSNAGSRKQSPSTNSRVSQKGIIRKNSPKGKSDNNINDKQPNDKQNQQNNSKTLFYDKDERKAIMRSPRVLEDYWAYQESMQRKILDYKERADQNLRKISDYNDKLHRLQDKFIDFDSVKYDIHSYKSQNRYLKSDTNDSFAIQTEHDQNNVKLSSSPRLRNNNSNNSPKQQQKQLSPSSSNPTNKYINQQSKQRQSNERIDLQYKLSQQEQYERKLENKLNNKSQYHNTELQENEQLGKMAKKYFDEKNRDQKLTQNQNLEGTLRLSHDLYNQIPPNKSIIKPVNQIDLDHEINQQQQQQQQNNQYKRIRRNSINKNQGDRFNTFQNYNNKLQEQDQNNQNNTVKLSYFPSKPDRSLLLTPEENELLLSNNNNNNYYNSPTNNRINNRNLSNEKNQDPLRLTNLQYKYLLEKNDYQQFLQSDNNINHQYPQTTTNRYSSINTTSKKQNPISPISNELMNVNPRSNSDIKQRKKSLNRMDIQQYDNYIRNKFGITEDLNNINKKNQRDSNYPHSIQFTKDITDLDNNFLPTINKDNNNNNRRVSLDTSQINQNKYNKYSSEMDNNIFKQQQQQSAKNNYFQRYHTPTNKNYLLLKEQQDVFK